jgi:hypothetical protein
MIIPILLGRSLLMMISHVFDDSRLICQSFSIFSKISNANEAQGLQMASKNYERLPLERFLKKEIKIAPAVYQTLVTRFERTHIICLYTHIRMLVHTCRGKYLP